MGSFDEVLLEVYDKDTGSKDDFMGRVSLPISELATLKKGQWIPLQKTKSGEICLSCDFVTELETSEASVDRDAFERVESVEELETATLTDVQTKKAGGIRAVKELLSAEKKPDHEFDIEHTESSPSDTENAKLEEESKQKAEAEEAKAKQEEEARLKSEADAAKTKEEEEASLKVEAEKEKQENEARLKAEAEAAKAKEEEEARLKAETEKAKQEEEARIKVEAEKAKQEEEEEARLKAEAEKAKQEEEARMKAEAE